MDLSTLRCHLLESMKQEKTPLNEVFFSQYNLDLLQRAIRQKFKDQTGISIDRQNDEDLLNYMRYVYINNSSNPYGSVCKQVQFMNGVVINEAMKDILTGVSQKIDYLRDIYKPFDPNAIPINTSNYGKKIDYNNKIGL